MLRHFNLKKISGTDIIDSEGNPKSRPKFKRSLNYFGESTIWYYSFLHITYKECMSSFKIDGIPYDLLNAANKIAKRFYISLGSPLAKAPNNLNQMSDPFHIWSRNAFYEMIVMKTDINK